MAKIVVGYDGSDHAKKALERAAELAKDNGSVTVVGAVHRAAPAVHGAMPLDPIELDERRRELEEAKEFLSAKGIEVHVVEGHGDPAENIVQQAGNIGADLIVVGTRGRNIAERMLLGSVSTSVVHHAPCDVLVVR